MKMTNFQLIVSGVFGLFIVAGIAAFALSGGLTGGTGVGTVTIWGTASQDTMDKTLATLRETDKSFLSVNYVQKDAATYQSTLVDAMAAGGGPDLFLLPQDDITQFGNKISLIPYTAVSQPTFTSSFVDEGQLFLTSQGSLALPLIVDPLVMYWNRDLFSSAGLAQPPQYWSDVLSMAPSLTVLGGNAAVLQSAAALGEWSNIAYAKEILSALFLQAGDPLVTYDQSGAPQSTLGITPQGATENPATSALTFYTDFANPSKTSYSWNHSLPEAGAAFAAGQVAMYFGFASDLKVLAAENPNLHFSVAMLPQIKGNTTKMTFGRLTGVALSRTAANPTGALTIAEKLTAQAGIVALVQASNLPSVRRDVALNTSASTAMTVFAQSALIARGWYDPNPSATDAIFKTMIESVVSGQNQPGSAVSQAAQSLSAILNGR